MAKVDLMVLAMASDHLSDIGIVELFADDPNATFGITTRGHYCYVYLLKYRTRAVALVSRRINADYFSI